MNSDEPVYETEQARLKKPHVLYSIINEKTAAGLDALLCSEQAAMASTLEYLSLNRVILGNGAFCLIAVKVNYLPENNQFENLLDANGSFAEMLEEELERRTIYYLVPLRGMVLCIISMPEYSEPSARIKAKGDSILQYCSSAQSNFINQTGIDVLISVSPICFGVDSLAGTFQRTVDNLHYHRFFGKKCGLFAPREALPPRNIALSYELEQTCITAEALLKGQDYVAFCSCLHKRIHILSEQNPCALGIFFAHCYQFLETLCCRLVQAGMADSSLLKQTDLYWTIYRTETHAELLSEIDNLLNQLTFSYQNKWNALDRTRITQMKKYIVQHIADPSLSVSALAEQFGLSQPSFSAYFKKQTGSSPLDYLNQLRVKMVCELLNEKKTLAEISKLAGFGSVTTMHRVFKQNVGITPAHLRNGGQI